MFCNSSDFLILTHDGCFKHPYKNWNEFPIFMNEGPDNLKIDGLYPLLSISRSILNQEVCCEKWYKCRKEFIIKHNMTKKWEDKDNVIHFRGSNSGAGGAKKRFKIVKEIMKHEKYRIHITKIDLCKCKSYIKIASQTPFCLNKYLFLFGQTSTFELC